MHTAFSERLAALRRERGLSQKEAAEQLDISAALLSHYEKGIRECGLSFVCKAAAFYDVSCDYILGVSDSRRAMAESFDDLDTPQDKEFRTVTLFRAATMLTDEMTAAGMQNRMRNYFALAIYRIAAQSVQRGVLPKSWLTLPASSAEPLSVAVMDAIIRSGIPASEKPMPMRTTPPTCVQTVVENSERILRQEFSKLLETDVK